MVTLAPSSTPRLGDSAIEKNEGKLTHLKKKNKSFKDNFPLTFKVIDFIGITLMRIICDAVVTAVEYSFRFSLVSAADGWRLGTLVVHF